MGDTEPGDQDDVSFLRTQDMVCLSCTGIGERVCLSAVGFGNRQCFLESISDRNFPSELSQCVFMIEQGLSVRALQELVTSDGEEAGSGSGMGSGHKTLLYGNAILLRHSNSNMFLACLSSSSSRDKLAFDVGLCEESEGESCWWTIHPSSKQRSEGEKVRVGDDAILVSVATERYLQATKEDDNIIVNASFHVTHWSVTPFATGLSRSKNVGCVFGGDVLRFFHAGDECLTIPSNWSDSSLETNIVIYEGGNVLTQARSLWRVELARTKWSGGYINWYHPMRIRHLTTGMYLGVDDDMNLCLLKREQASLANSCFYFRETKDDNKVILEDKDLEVIGTPMVYYDGTCAILQHIDSGLWLSYKTNQVKKKGVGIVEEKQLVLHEEGKMDDGLTFSRSQDEEARTAEVIRKCLQLFGGFIAGLESIVNTQRLDGFMEMVDMGEVLGCLEDLITYFSQPSDDMIHEERQKFLKALRNRQDLFQEEGILNLILDAIDKMNVVSSHGLFSSVAGEEAGQNWTDISGFLFQLLAAIIRGNHTNCSQFAQAQRLNWLFSKLGSQAGSEGAGMMDVLYCILNDSPEALNMMQEEHIKVIISLLEKFGRDPKVLDILSNLCVGSGVAVRSSQNNIVDFLLPGKNLLLHTAVVNYVASARPNMYVGYVKESALYSKWYYEVTLDFIEAVGDLPLHLRIGWASTAGFTPYPGGGEKWGGNGVGDDLYSFGFDGANLWTGGRSTPIVPNPNTPFLKKGDNIGVALDLSVPIMTFFLNGVKVPGYFRNFNLDGMFFPVVSSSAKVSCRFLFGGDQGRLKYSPPSEFSPLYESMFPMQELRIEPGFYFGETMKNQLHGPFESEECDVAFVPNPLDTSGMQLSSSVESVKEKLAENIHEMWAVSKIENGWTYADERNDEELEHPCLTQFQNLPYAEKRYNIQLAVQTLRTIMALGYTISVDKPPSRIRTMRLSNEPFLQSNGYKPSPLDLAAIELGPKMEALVELLAENTHNVWAKERIAQSWTYGLNEDIERKRSPHLLQYSFVDEAIKIANRNSASDTIKTLMVYGYVLDPPSGDHERGTEEMNSIKIHNRTYRLEKTYGVTSGRWYYEVEILTEGCIKIGWQTTGTPPQGDVGDHGTSWSFNGTREEKIHAGVYESYGKLWKPGDIVGVFLDLTDRTVSFSLNGELLVDQAAGDAAFSEVTGEEFVPALTLGSNQACKTNFGHNVDTLVYFTTCGLQEGYEPFCVNMSRPVTFWYTKRLPIFESFEDIDDCRVDVTRLPSSSDSSPSLKISHVTYEQEEKADWEFLRLSMPVTVQENLISDFEKSKRLQMVHSSMRQRPNSSNRMSQGDRDFKGIEDSAGTSGTNALPPGALAAMNEYFYGVRIFPGQDPNVVYVGWITTQYHIHSADFSQDLLRHTTIQKLDQYGRIQTSLDRHSSYIVRADELYNQVSPESSGKTPSQGLFIGCFVDTSTGIIHFTCEGKQTQKSFVMEPGTKLFPAVFFKATTKDALQFELGRTPTSLPYSSAILLNSGKHINPQLPPRLKVQCLKPHQWARVPNKNFQIHSLKLSDIRGWSLLCEDQESMMALHIPEEDRCIDIYELIEQDRLLSFHVQTLKLYEALCFQSNFKAQHIICRYCDGKQLLYAIQSPYMPGQLRRAFFDTLIALHLESYANTILSTKEEFIIPMGQKVEHLYNELSLGNSMESAECASIRPLMSTSPIQSDPTAAKCVSMPYFPLDLVKDIVMSSLENACQVNQVHNRDPIGGSNEDLFVPLIKLIDKLLLVGALSDEDILQLLTMIHPKSWAPEKTVESESRKGILDMKVQEGVKLQLCHLLHHLCDLQMRHMIESIVAFCQHYMVDLQADQLRRYIDIKQSDMPSAVAAKKTKEFRCPPREQMKTILGFKNLDAKELDDHPCTAPLRNRMTEFHERMLKESAISSIIEESDSEGSQEPVDENPSVFSVVLKALREAGNPSASSSDEDGDQGEKSCESKFRKVLVDTLVRWGQESFISSNDLVREMFSLLLRQYDIVGELIVGCGNTYIVDPTTDGDVTTMWVSLSRIRSLLPVQMSKEEEALVRELLWNLVNNHVFFQHPDLIRILRVHENVIDIMMNSISRSSQDSSENGDESDAAGGSDSSAYDMVVACCRFLCYFCRTSRQNQRAMFDHLEFILEHANLLLSRPSLRGSAPLDVAYSSLMDNTELALALREHHLDKIALYLSRCGLTGNMELIARGYPDLGWDPVEGERFLDFLRFCVWVGGESVEENANLVIRLLIRRPECLGPALRGEGEGLLKAIISGNDLSEQIAIKREHPEYQHDLQHPLPAGDDDEDWIDTGSAILSFYSTLVDLLGRCAPEATLIAQGKNDSLRARAILKSLVPLEDLQGVLGLRFHIRYERQTDDESDMPSGLIPNHKQSMALFLERVYGVEDKQLFFSLLENAFLPDLRSATMLDKSEGESDMGLALNRYIGNSVLPSLVKYNRYYGDAENQAPLLEATLHTVYRLSKGKMLTNVQRQVVSDFLVTLTKEIHPAMLLKLLRQMTVDLSNLNEYSNVALKMLTLFYERCSKYYCSQHGQGSYGCASEEEKRLTMSLFLSIFDSLSKMEYEPELFGKALPCLTAIGCALPPDYFQSSHGDDSIYYKKQQETTVGQYTPTPIDTKHVDLNNDLLQLVSKFSEHYHDAWAQRKFEAGWTYDQRTIRERKLHNRLKPFHNLSQQEKDFYQHPVFNTLKAMVSLGWEITYNDTMTSARDQPSSSHQASHSGSGYNPSPADMTNLTLSRELVNLGERLAEDAHDIDALNKIESGELTGLDLTLVPYDLLTDKEKRKTRERSQELLKYIQYKGYDLSRIEVKDTGSSSAARSSKDNRFASNLLEKLIMYLDSSAPHMKLLKPSANFSRRTSYQRPNRSVKFFSKVVLPLMEKYFHHHRAYFTSIAYSMGSAGVATIKEKEAVASLFCKLASLLRARQSAFGSDMKQAVKCLQVLVKAIDARSLAKSRPEFVRTSMLLFFNNCADDLEKTIYNLQEGRLPHLRGTHMVTSTSIGYIFDILVPVLISTFDHLSAYEFGQDLLVDEIQVSCFKIIECLYVLGTNVALTKSKRFLRQEITQHRANIGVCLAAISSTFPVAFLEPSLHKYNPHSVIGSGFAKKSLEAQEVVARMEHNIPSLDNLVLEIQQYVEEGKTFADEPQVIEVLIPFLCSYLTNWWLHGPDNENPKQGGYSTMVTSVQLNSVFKIILNLIKKHVGDLDATWMSNIATHANQIIIQSSGDLLQEPVLPLAKKCHERVEQMFHKEEACKGYLKAAMDDASQVEGELQEQWAVIVRDLYAFLPLLIKFVDIQRSHWIKNKNESSEVLYNIIGEMFNIFMASGYFKREEQNFLTANEIDPMALIMPSGSGRTRNVAAEQAQPNKAGGAQVSKKKKLKKEKQSDKSTFSSLVVTALKRMLPVGLNLFAGREQELVQHCKDKFLQKYRDDAITDFVRTQLTLPLKIDLSDELSWQHHLYSTLGNRQSIDPRNLKPEALESLIQRIITMGRILYGLHMIDHPSGESSKSGFPKVVSIQRKRAVIACFRQTSLHSLPLHSAINLFLRTYRENWLEDDNIDQELLIDHLTKTFEDSETNKDDTTTSSEEEEPDQLKQLIFSFCQGAMMQTAKESEEDELYLAYADIMARSCGAEDEEEGDGDEGGEGTSLQEQEIEKMKLLFNQGRLADRGASEMVLYQISACGGTAGNMIENTLRLGISILRGGNVAVQTAMLATLKERRDTGFFTSISGLMNSCTVLDLDAFERNTKAEGLGVGPDGPAGEKNMHDAEFTSLLFRFIQLTSEGHNNDWQNYLRSQAGNTTTVNLVICTVDYLLRLQESMMDFYWYYSRKELIDNAGKSNLLKAIGVASQVFNTLTEVIQGPCVGNQQTLAHSRLWDAVSGFLFLFAHMQEKLSKHSSQVDLLQELLNLQKDLIVMLLSMLEGNILNGTIGKQMLDTLVESSATVEMILQYFNLFLNLPAEDELDLKDGTIDPNDFRERLEQAKSLSSDEIDFILLCCDTNHDGKIDYPEFNERFLEPAKEIGFNLAVLLTNLSEHMPNDPRLVKFLETAGTVLEYFEPYLGRIEIKTSDKIERVYFEIDGNNIEQWEKPQIKESKRAFFYATITEGGDKEKLECFVDFCEDAIFEMQHAESLMSSSEDGGTSAVASSGPRMVDEETPTGIIKPLKASLQNLKESVAQGMKAMSPSNLKRHVERLKGQPAMTSTMEILQMLFWLLYFLGFIIVNILGYGSKILVKVMRGDIFGYGADSAKTKEQSKSGSNETSTSVTSSPSSSPSLLAQQEAVMSALDASKLKPAAKQEEGVSSFDFGLYMKKALSFLARKFFTMKFIALAIAFLINFMLLFFKVSVVASDEEDVASLEEGDEDEGDEEFVTVDERYYYLEYIIRFLGIAHAFVSLCMLVAYYNLKVPLAIFKREKEVARRLEFDGLYLAEQPDDDDIKAHWDKLVISARSFPALYWDKFVKKRVRQKYCEQFEFDAISNILGMEKSAIIGQEERHGIWDSLVGIDWRYQIWKAGVTITDSPFQYQLWYFLFSLLGNLNYFFFAAHLLDVAFGVAALRIILEAITHNGKQLILTVMLLTIIVYIYTVIAFNFFRRFYVSEEEEQIDQKCHDMLTCFVFHLYKGVRAGGGIGDEIEPPDGDEYEVYRILFDISFFFFIIVILLAIIQGFIIDAFGALRDQMQGVEDELENNCFICGIGKDYLDKIPHGFDIHVQKEHNLANYLFFLMYLINKDETEYTGQETHVWNMYQNRCWDFFPAGDCFRKQYEDELISS